MKIFNFGLPRTGTTSFHRYMLSNSFNSVHTNNGFINICFPDDYYNFLNDIDLSNNYISCHINKYDVFSDLPWYSVKLRNKIIQKYKDDPNVYFVYTIRDKKSWIKSIRKIIPHINQSASKQFHEMEYNGNLSELNDDQLDIFYDKFYSELKADSNIHELSLDNIDVLKNTLNKLFNTNINMEYPHVI